MDTQRQVRMRLLGWIVIACSGFLLVGALVLFTATWRQIQYSDTYYEKLHAIAAPYGETGDSLFVCMFKAMRSSDEAKREMEKLKAERVEFFERVEERWDVYRFLMGAISYPVAFRSPDVIQSRRDFWPALAAIPVLAFAGIFLITRAGQQSQEVTS